MSGNTKQGRKPIHDPAFKIAVARDYLTSSLGYGAIAEKYGLPGISTARFFVKWYKNQSLEDPVNNEAPSAQSRQLKDANLKITALEMLIKEAGKELGVDLVKKFGTKQSGK